MDRDTLAMARGNYGYGRWEAPYWFIGPEQGMGRHENNDLSRRVNEWLALDSRELNDCRDFHRRIGDMRWHFKKPRVELQKTWRPLMLLMAAFLNRSVDNESLRDYQRDRWGVLDEKAGETCVIELSGLAAPSLKESRETGRYLQERIEVIRGRIRDHRPKLVVMYGKRQKDSWEKIAGSAFPLEPGNFLNDGPTILAFTPHPVSRICDGNRYLGNEYWTRLGRNLRDLARRSTAAGRNVFKDLGVPNADEHFVKAQLVLKIDTLVKERGLKQVEAADLFGIRQPDVSKMLGGEFRQFSVERLLRFLVALDQDVEILVKPHRDSKNPPALHVF